MNNKKNMKKSCLMFVCVGVVFSFVIVGCLLIFVVVFIFYKLVSFKVVYGYLSEKIFENEYKVFFKVIDKIFVDKV